jgi:hypothetical protein
MVYKPAFYNLNLLYARKAAEVRRMDPAEALLRYTYLYVHFGLGRDFNPRHPVWQEYRAGLFRADDDVEWTARFALQREIAAPRPAEENQFGCFSYSIGSGGRLRLHFHNNDPRGVGPLSPHRLRARLAELQALFADVRERQLPVLSVVGGSWLYNLPAYRRLFPPAFITTALASYEDFQFLALWGQFLDRSNDLRPQAAARFLANLLHASTPAALDQCFPFPVLRLECPLEFFHDFYTHDEKKLPPPDMTGDRTP